MPPEQFDALKADIAERGVLVPIDVDEHGHILDGHHRHRACTELGITDYPTIVRPGLSESDKRIFARKANALRRHLNRAQLRQIIAEQLKDTPNWANNRIAGELGADGKTVATVREALESTSEIPKFERLIGADGKERPVKQTRPPAILASDTDELARILEQLKSLGGAGNADLADFAGFFSEGKFAAACTIVSKNYDPFAGRSEAERAEWKRFIEYIADGDEAAIDGICRHVEWIFQRPFQNVSEWLGPTASAWRQRCGMRSPSPEFIAGWTRYNAEALGEAA